MKKLDKNLFLFSFKNRKKKLICKNVLCQKSKLPQNFEKVSREFCTKIKKWAGKLEFFVFFTNRDLFETLAPCYFGKIIALQNRSMSKVKVNWKVWTKSLNIFCVKIKTTHVIPKGILFASMLPRKTFFSIFFGNRGFFVLTFFGQKRLMSSVVVNWNPFQKLLRWCAILDFSKTGVFFETLLPGYNVRRQVS